MSREAQVDRFGQMKGGSNIAFKLLNSGMDISVLRPVGNASLRYEEWVQFDDAVLATSQKESVVVNDLIARGLTYNVPDALGTMVLAWQTEGDLGDAELTMSGLNEATKDDVEYGDMQYLPLAIIHKNFQIDIRRIHASRKFGVPLDVGNAAKATTKVMQKIESMCIAGCSSYAFGGGYIYGLEDAPNKNTGTLNHPWTASAASGASMVDDVLRMMKALKAKQQYGPYVLYIPTAVAVSIEADYAAAKGDNTIRDRLMKITGLEGIIVSDFMTSTKIVLAQAKQETIRLVRGMNPTLVQWESDGGMMLNFKVMAIMIPQVRSEKSTYCGIAVYSN